MQNTKHSLRIPQWLIVCLFFCFYTFLAANLPSSSCPDELMRSQIPFWIVEHNALPFGNEPELAQNIWGFSYAFLPYLPSIIAAGFIKVVSLFTTALPALQLAMRMVSVLSGTMCVLLAFLIAPYLFKSRLMRNAFPLFIGLMPQVCFLSGYLNNDIFSLMGSMGILYFLLSGHEKKWPVSHCVGLGVSMSACLLSYYHSYGWLVVCAGYCVVAVLRDERIDKKWSFIFGRAGLIAGVVLLLSGWHFIRNLVIYDGDLLGYQAMTRCVDAVEASGVQVFRGNNIQAQGHSFLYMLAKLHWITQTAKSFIGVFGNMTISLSALLYCIYTALIAVGAVSGLITFFQKKQTRLLGICLVIAAIIPVILSLYTSYVRDFQPQGRYIITVLPSVAVLMAAGYERLSSAKKGAAILRFAAPFTIALWVVLGTISLVGYLLPMFL